MFYVCPSYSIYIIGIYQQNLIGVFNFYAKKLAKPGADE